MIVIVLLHVNWFLETFCWGCVYLLLPQGGTGVLLSGSLPGAAFKYCEQFCSIDTVRALVNTSGQCFSYSSYFSTKKTDHRNKQHTCSLLNSKHNWVEKTNTPMHHWIFSLSCSYFDSLGDWRDNVDMWSWIHFIFQNLQHWSQHRFL